VKRTPLNPKRTTPRRNEGRVAHKRMKPKAKVVPTTEQGRFFDLLKSLGCLICGGPANVHHLMHAPGKERRRDHRFVVPLCQCHHQGNNSVHDLGSEDAFRAFWGVDLIGWGIAAWSNRNAPDAPFWRDSVTRCRAIARRRLLEHKGGGEQPEGRTTVARPA
jgi:Recombination enhancement, RecA-dependent nuclease